MKSRSWSWSSRFNGYEPFYYAYSLQHWLYQHKIHYWGGHHGGDGDDDDDDSPFFLLSLTTTTIHVAISPQVVAGAVDHRGKTAEDGIKYIY